MKPKMYRKTKPSNGSDMARFKNNDAGGPVQLVTNPPSAAGQTDGPCIVTKGPTDGSKPSIPIRS